MAISLQLPVSASVFRAKSCVLELTQLLIGNVLKTLVGKIEKSNGRGV